MSTTAVKLLANTKTRNETGFEHVLSEIEMCTPYGVQRKKDLRPFLPGEEEFLNSEYDDTDVLCLLAEKHSAALDELIACLWEIKEMSLTLSRSLDQTLTIVELFDVKTFLLNTKKISDILKLLLPCVPESYTLKDTIDLLNVLDPSGERIDTFYLYDAFSPTLAVLRKEKRQLDLDLRREQKAIGGQLEKEYGFRMNPKCELLIPKADKNLLDTVLNLSALQKIDEDYMSLVFTIAATGSMDEIIKKQALLEEKIEQEEFVVRQYLTGKIAESEEALRYNCAIIGNLDFGLGKARYAVAHECSRPVILQEHKIKIRDGRNLAVEDILKKQNKTYCPVSIELSDGVSAITGANMGGKTISLKMLGQVALLTQYGFYVPCKEAEIGLSNFVQILIGDSQNVQRGLSSFGSEMEELREILDHGKDRSLIMIDEIASGTNPTEGLALTKSFIAYFAAKPYITVITTHFDYATVGKNITNLQVMGLSGADFSKLSKEIAGASRKERIEIIGKYMDYRLHRVEGTSKVPREALNIAKMLGIYDEIIEVAKTYLM